MAIFIATCETRNFSFLAVGDSKAQARMALIHGARRHSQEYTLGFKSGDALIEAYGIDYLEPVAGQLNCATCYREGSLIWHEGMNL